MTAAVETQVRDPRAYVERDVWDREIQLLMRDHPVDEVMANRLFGAAVSYLVTAMEKWGQGLEMCCGRLVDLAVHVFILDTRNYREFCAENFDGKFLEHIPEAAPTRCPTHKDTSHSALLRSFMSDLSHAPMTPAEYWDRYKPYRGEGAQPAPQADLFDWTQYPGHGPGAEVLGRPRRALELGPAEGKEAAHLARRGVEVTGVDFSPVQVERARTWWQDTSGLSFVQGEACAYLSASPEEYDAIFSVWGAVWFTDPEDLFPCVLKRLAPGGVFAFSQAEPVAGAYGPQQMRGKWLEGRERELTVRRWQYAPAMWADILRRHGFTDIDARILKAPEPGSLGTLIVCAHTPA